MEFPGPNASVEDFKRVLKAVRDDTKVKPATWQLWHKMLRCHYAMPSHRITAEQMAEKNDMSHFVEANGAYGKFAHEVANRLHFVPAPRPSGDRGPMWWLTFSTGSQGDDRGSKFELTMRPELVAALEQMRWVTPNQP